ncbi:MAG: sulfate transporter [Planctomycetes bacterium]|nr:sulfate transporter [Planctomycetota bacterium]
MGTFLPLLVAMSAQNGLDFASALFFAGVFNVVTALAFGIPMAVQPMKAIAAVALAEGLTAPQILAAGISVSALLLVLSLTGLVDWIQRNLPKSAIRGLQLALGLSLAIRGLESITSTHAWFALDGYLPALLAAFVCCAPIVTRRVPAALVIFGAGIVLALVRKPELVHALGLGLHLPAFAAPSMQDFESALPKAVLPQLPLTLLNSVIAVCALSADLFPDKPAAPKRVALSVAAMNLVAGWFGGMPMCHGSGGLAGQVRFGARTGGSILILGAAKILCGLFLGASLIALCAAFPASLLGVMLVISGVELALVARDQHSRADAFVVVATAAACIGLGHIGLGLLLGLVLGGLLRLGWFRAEEG